MQCFCCPFRILCKRSASNSSRSLAQSIKYLESLLLFLQLNRLSDKGPMNWIGPDNLPYQRRILSATIAIGLLFCLLILCIAPPATLPLPKCMFQTITGHGCLTCGMTRSFHAILHGKLGESLRFHLFGPLLFLSSLLFIAVFAFESISGKRVVLGIQKKTKIRFFAMAAIIWFMYWGVRIISEYAST
jgi:hypothetical protein